MIQPGLSQQIERELRLWDYYIPQITGVIRRHSRYYCKEVGLKRTYSTFCGVAAVYVGRYELEVRLTLVCDELSIRHTCLIIQHLEVNVMSADFESLHNSIVGL